MKSNPWLVGVLASLAACTKSTPDGAATTAAEPAPAAPGSAHAQSTTPDLHRDSPPVAEAAPGAVAVAAPGGDGADIVAIGASGKAKVIATTGGPATIDGDAYTIKLSVPKSVPKGAEGVVTLDLVPKKGWHLNKEFPTKLSITPPDGVSVKKPEQALPDATAWTEEAGQFSIAFTAAAAGPKQFAGKFKFAVCTDTTCDPKREELAWSVAVD